MLRDFHVSWLVSSESDAHVFVFLTSCEVINLCLLQPDSHQFAPTLSQATPSHSRTHRVHTPCRRTVFMPGPGRRLDEARHEQRNVVRVEQS